MEWRDGRMETGYVIRVKFECFKDYEIIGETMEDSIKKAEKMFLSEQRNDFNNAKYIDVTDVSIASVKSFLYKDEGIGKEI